MVELLIINQVIQIPDFTFTSQLLMTACILVGRPKVCNFHVPAVRVEEQEVFAFEVAVDDHMLMEKVQATQQLAAKALHVPGGEALGMHPLQQLAYGAPGAVFE